MAADRLDGYEVVVVGHGLAGLAAALAAREAGARVVVVEKSPEADRGGHTRFSGGVFRVPIEDPAATAEAFDLAKLPEEFTGASFLRELTEAADGRGDPELLETLVDEAYPTLEWLAGHGLEFGPALTDERGWSGSSGRLQHTEQGAGTIETLTERAAGLGVEFRYETRVDGLRTDGTAITGVEAATPDGRAVFDAQAAVLCAGSYVASPEKRARYFGPKSHAYVVRGSRYNTGEVLDAAVDVGAATAGHFAGGHQAVVDANAPPVEGGRTRINGYQYGVLLNAEGERFVDEGADHIANTFSPYGRAVLEQPGSRAFVIFDAQVADHVSSQMGSEPVTSGTLEGLIDAVGIPERETALETLQSYNAATTDGSFDPARLDGRATSGLDPEKSNWAVPIEEPPFGCFPVVAGITWGFGGLAVTADGRVRDTTDGVVDGLYAAGNTTAGFFAGYRAVGASLTRAATFGRLAGQRAAAYALR